MELTNTREILHVRDADLTDSRFSSAKLASAQFDDVNRQESTFVDVNLAGAKIRNVNLAGVTIEDANLTGMSINGALVTDLIHAFDRRARMVLYAKDLATMREFYQGVFHLEIEQSEAGSRGARIIHIAAGNRPSAGVHRVHYSHSRSAGSQSSNTGKTGV
jgi:hypothetical protein